MEALVRARGVRMAFGGVEVVRGVDLDLNAGEVHAIVGENGAGKSTLAKIIAGVYRPAGGTVEVDGREVRIENPRHAIELGIALIHQEPLTFPDLDVTENIFAGHHLVRRPGAVDWREMRAKTSEILDGLGVGLKPRQRVGGLSVADQQMVELASALSRDAKVLLMDETTAALTPKEVAELFSIVRRLRDQGRAIAFVSHHLDEVFEIADRITVMRDGEKVAELRPGETSIREVVRLMVGRDIEITGSVSDSRTSAPSGSPSPPVLKLTEPSPTFPWRRGEGFGLVGGTTPDRSANVTTPRLRIRDLTVAGRFEGISFDVGAGEILGLGGLVGAGRTDVCRAMFGIDRASGTVEIHGRAVRIRNPRDAMANGIALVPEDRQHEGLLMPMSIGQNGSLAVLRRIARRGWLQDKAETSAVRAYLEELHTAYRSITSAVSELSGGNQQKVVLAKWLLTDPKILILDEPTRGVDVGAKAEVHRLIRELAARGIAVLLVSSDLPELLALADRVLVMHQGKAAGEFERSEATPEAVMLAATGQPAGASA